ncbi:MAG: hypothetical protein LKI92_04635 [Schleiferilactobacillus harbinensis]|jgi:hypothetical protein|nr:hypothetical protein [Schleiferilactobacillus harbinensis]MCI1912507.1 hypothetical protein [Schleiferilactobacillus harbinensis]
MDTFKSVILLGLSLVYVVTSILYLRGSTQIAPLNYRLLVWNFLLCFSFTFVLTRQITTNNAFLALVTTIGIQSLVGLVSSRLIIANRFVYPAISLVVSILTIFFFSVGSGF